MSCSPWKIGCLQRLPAYCCAHRWLGDSCKLQSQRAALPARGNRVLSLTSVLLSLVVHLWVPPPLHWGPCPTHIRSPQALERNCVIWRWQGTQWHCRVDHLPGSVFTGYPDSFLETMKAMNYESLNSKVAILSTRKGRDSISSPLLLENLFGVTGFFSWCCSAAGIASQTVLAAAPASPVPSCLLPLAQKSLWLSSWTSSLLTL